MGKKDPIIFSKQNPSLIFPQITFYLSFQFRLINYQLPAGHKGDFSLLSMAQWQQRPTSFSASAY